MFSFNDIMPTKGGAEINKNIGIIVPKNNGPPSKPHDEFDINKFVNFNDVNNEIKVNKTNQKPLTFDNTPLINGKRDKEVKFKKDNKKEDDKTSDNPKYENPLTTRESLFLPINKIDKDNAPIPELPEQVNSRYLPIKEVIYEVPRVENRFLNLAENPYQDISRLNFLYEDFIPEPLLPTKITTVTDRFNLWDFIRLNVMNLYTDGYNTDKKFIGHAEKSIIDALSDYDNVGISRLFSKVKSLKFNPNVLDRSKDISNGFKIYKSCYPIKRDGNKVSCSNIGQFINLRIYQTPLLTDDITTQNDKGEEIKCKVIRSNIEDLDLDLSHIGKEFEFYEYIKDAIVSKKESPNFPICYGIVRNLFD